VTGRYVVGALGILAIAVGALQVIENWSEASPFGLAAFLVAVIVLDDLVLVPVALAIGWAVTRYLPRHARPPAQVALVVFAGLAVVAIPFALSPARDGEHGTLLTEAYALNLALLAVLLAAVAGVTILGRRWWQRRSARATSP
jgi:hypothetical protein